MTYVVEEALVNQHGTPSLSIIDVPVAIEVAPNRRSLVIPDDLAGRDELLTAVIQQDVTFDDVEEAVHA